MQSRRNGILLISIYCLFFSSVGHAYVLEGQKWPDGSVVMQLQLGSVTGSLIDGNTSWNDVAEGALATWNVSLGRLQFMVVRNSAIPIISGDGENSVFWSSTVFGSPFGSSTLAITQRWFSGTTLTEADVVFNNAKPWNSYRGALRPASDGVYLNDLRRVALHEFGHVLGLNHPDLAGQIVVAQMNSIESDLDGLAADDIAGAQALYGAPVPPTPWPDATDLGSGWKSSSWFGVFNVNNYPWIYHQQHGFMYVFGTDPASIWFWASDMGFLWSSSTVYPWLWSDTKQTWLYYAIGSQSPRFFFNWNTQQWEQH